MMDDLKSRLWGIEAALGKLREDAIAVRQCALSGSEEKRQSRRLADRVNSALQELARVED